MRPEIELGPKDVLTVEAWRDPLVEALGHDARSAYVERFWLPVLGPSTVLLLRRLAGPLERSPGGMALRLAETSRSLGLGERLGRNSTFLRTISRTIEFELARLVAPARLAVRTVLPPLPRRYVVRLPEQLREELSQAERLAPSRVVAADQRLRGRQLALSLVELGEDEAATERQLLRWRFHPALARECSEWAAATRRGTPAREAPPAS